MEFCCILLTSLRMLHPLGPAQCPLNQFLMFVMPFSDFIFNIILKKNNNNNNKKKIIILKSDHSHLFANQFTTYLQPVINWPDSCCERIGIMLQAGWNHVVQLVAIRSYTDVIL